MSSKMSSSKPASGLAFSIYDDKKYIFYMIYKTLLMIPSESKTYFYEALPN